MVSSVARRNGKQDTGDSRRSRARAAAALAFLMIAALTISFAKPGEASLAASTFEGADGNQIVDDTTSPKTDWESFLPDETDDNLFIVLDEDSGATDNALAGGTKDNTECPNVTLGTIPKNKDDLLRFYLYHETIDDPLDDPNVGPQTFLYLGYVRALPSGTTASAHGVFELNQADTPCPDLPGKGKTAGAPSPFLDRTADDVRIAFDDEGGDSPVISVQRWIEPCVTGGTAGCWSGKDVLDVQEAAGAFNDEAISDRLNGDPSTTLSLKAEQFGEVMINMDAAGLLSGSGCEGFGAASLFTGSSGNSDQEQSKDFIAPQPINLNFCEPATVTVNKTFSGVAPEDNAVFDLYYDTDGSDDLDVTEDELLDTCTIEPGDLTGPDSDGDYEGTCSFADLEFGTAPFTTQGPHRLIVTESTVPTGFTGGPDVLIEPFSFGSTALSFDADFTNSPAPGDVDLKKVDDNDAPLENAVFTLYEDDGATAGSFDDVGADPDTSTGRTCTTGSDGVCLEDGVTDPTHAFHALDLGDYCVVETTTPAGYDTADPQCFTIGLGEAGQTLDLGEFVDPRQHRVIVIVCHEGDDTLFPSDVTLEGATDADDVTEESLGTSPITGVSEQDLCTLGGAQFDDLSGHDQRGLTVDLGSPGHPSP